MAATSQLQARSWTRALRFPKVIGRLPGMNKLWGGPYSYAQIATGVVCLLLLAKFHGLWAQFGLAGNAIILIGLPFGLMYAVRRARVEGRSLPAYAVGLLAYVFARAVVRVTAARAVAPIVLAPHTVLIASSSYTAAPALAAVAAPASAATVCPAQAAEPSATSAQPPVRTPALRRPGHTPRPAPGLPVTNLERLLAAASAAQTPS